MAQRISRTKKILVVAAVGALTIGGAGAAYAYWTSTGTGDGSATTGQEALFVITTQPLTGTGEISPGSPGRTVPFTVTNPGPGQLFLGNVTVAIADEDGIPWEPEGDCLLADYSAIVTTMPTTGTMLVGTDFARSGVVTVTLASSEVNQDDCQGQVVPLHFIAESEIPN